MEWRLIYYVESLLPHSHTEQLSPSASTQNLLLTDWIRLTSLIRQINKTGQHSPLSIKCKERILKADYWLAILRGILKSLLISWRLLKLVKVVSLSPDYQLFISDWKSQFNFLRSFLYPLYKFSSSLQGIF